MLPEEKKPATCEMQRGSEVLESSKCGTIKFYHQAAPSRMPIF
jgi:hypothetical protein